MESIKPWARKDKKLIADCRVLTIHESVSISPMTEQEHNFYVMDTTDWVNIVPVTDKNEIVCIRQFRHGSEEITLEIPGGMVDEGEAPDVSAARECLEETGYETDELISLGTLSPNPALFSNQLHTYLAPGVKRVAEVDNTSTEHTEVQLIPLEQVVDMLISGEINHALVAATLWRMLYFIK